MARGALSNLGYKIALTAVGDVPTTIAELQAALLNSWESKGPTKTSANVVENNRVDGDGYSRHTAIIKTWEAMPIKFWKDDAATFATLKAQYEKNTSDEDFYIDLIFMVPKTTEFASVKDYILTGQITSFEEAGANTTEAQSFTIIFQPSGAPVDFTIPIV